MIPKWYLLLFISFLCPLVYYAFFLQTCRITPFVQITICSKKEIYRIKTSVFGPARLWNRFLSKTFRVCQGEKRCTEKVNLCQTTPMKSFFWPHQIAVCVVPIVVSNALILLLIPCSKYNIADGMRQMFDPFERVARAHHFCPCCERSFSAEEEDSFVKKVGTFTSYHNILTNNFIWFWIIFFLLITAKREGC